MPPVVLSKGHEALCRLKVGDTMPDIELEQLRGGRRKLADLAGKKATVVVFWKRADAWRINNWRTLVRM